MKNRLRVLTAAFAGALLIAPHAGAAAASYVDITWFSISNIFYELGPAGIVTDGYITRIPQSAFHGGGGGLASTDRAYKPDVDGVKRVLDALGGASHVNLLLTGHSHFDHSFDTAVWSQLTGARIIGSTTTCLQVQAQQIPASRCTAVSGGENVELLDNARMWVVRWNHSGSSAQNPEQHDPVELKKVPVPDPVTGGLHPGVAEDFPNGGGNRAYLFGVDAPDGRFSWLFTNSASPADLKQPIVVDGVNYGAPLDNLVKAMKDAGLSSVDLWLGTGGVDVAHLVVPVLHPKAYLPVHWDGLYGDFWKGVPKPYEDRPLENYLAGEGIRLVKPAQYMDKWRLDRRGIRPIENALAKKALGF